MDKNISVSYLTIEDVFGGLFVTQVERPLSVLSQKNRNIMVRIFAVNYFWKFFSKKRELAEIKSRLAEANVKLTVIPFLIPVKYTMSNKLYCIIFLKLLIIIISLIPRSQIIHCRGYFTTIAAAKSRRREKVIFDMRSLWVLENIAAKTLLPDSSSAVLWRNLEKFAMDRSDAIIGVSAPMGDYVKSLGRFENYWTIPISADVQSLGYCGVARSRLRREFGLRDDDVVAVYSGSLGLARVNVKPLVSLMGIMSESNPSLKFLILSNEDEESLRALCEDAGIDQEDVRLASVSPMNIGSYLSIADFGFHALPPQPDSDTRLGTKVVEYWANGLPVIVSSTVGAAAEMCKTYAIGLVVNLNDPESLFLRELPTRSSYEPQLRKFDAGIFDINTVAQSYARVYNDVEGHVSVNWI